MAGIGFELRKIFKKNSVASLIEGIGYSSLITIGPMVTVIGMLMLIFQVVDYSSLEIMERELMSSTILYVFIFSLLFTAPFNSVLSRYVADKIYEEKYEDILPSFYTGLVMNLLVVVFISLPFYIWEYAAGGVGVVYVFGSFCMFTSLTVIFYCMLYLSATKDYKIIAVYFLAGMTAALLAVVVLVYLFGAPVPVSVIYGMTFGFLLTGALESAYLKKYFYNCSDTYLEVLKYFKRFYKLFFSNLFYTLGLFIHNFVFWFSPLRHTVVRTYISAQPYDMATCIAMFTNISVTVIFIVLMETKFSAYYKDYTENVTGGTYRMIEKAKSRMFRVLNQQIINIVQIQFIISMVVFLLAVIFLPSIGIGGKTMLIYPVLAAAYFVIFIMYCLVIFLYYFDDETGALITTLVFCAAVLAGSLLSMRLPVRWYGLGVFFGALCGWTTGYFRLIRLERVFDCHIFCRGSVIPEETGELPDNNVYTMEGGLVSEVPGVLVSIIVPVHNGAGRLLQCIQSVQKQNYRKFEILVIDSGSTDGTAALCGVMADRYPGLRVLHKENEGRTVAMNIGILNARGEFLLFLDAGDEFVSETVLDKLLRSSLDAGSDMTAANSRRRRLEDGGFAEGQSGYGRMKPGTAAFRYRGFFSDKRLARTGGILYSRKFLVGQMIAFRESSCTALLFNIECYAKGAVCGFIDDIVYEYGRAEETLGKALGEGRAGGRIQMLTDISRILADAEKKKPYLDFVLHAALTDIITEAKEVYWQNGKHIKAVKEVFKRCRREKQTVKVLRRALFSGKTGSLFLRIFSLGLMLHMDLLLAFGIRLAADFGSGREEYRGSVEETV